MLGICLPGQPYRLEAQLQSWVDLQLSHRWVEPEDPSVEVRDLLSWALALLLPLVEPSVVTVEAEMDFVALEAADPHPLVVVQTSVVASLVVGRLVEPSCLEHLDSTSLALVATSGELPVVDHLGPYHG